ncbi:MAG: substrate-binding domain-containing protein, partial [Propioniciclava sp.]
RTSPVLDGRLRHELDLIEANGGRVVALGLGADGFRNVSVDNTAGGRALGAALAARGYCRAIALVAAEGMATSDARLAGFTDGFTTGGAAPPQVLRGAFTREAGEQLMTQALADGVQPGTVVWGVNDVVAIGALRAIRAVGREPGTDIALAGFDDIPMARDVTPTLTTVQVPLNELGYRALHAGLDDELPADLVPLSLEVRLRESTPPQS